MRWYRLLLHLYPRSFRNEYGAELLALFARRRREASGIVGVSSLWLDATLDVIGNATAVHWDLLRQDLRHTARSLARAPIFALTAMAVAALGIGANTAAFSVADFVLVRPLPFANPERLVTLWQSGPGFSTLELSPPNFHDWRESLTSFDAIGAYHGVSANLVDAGEPQRLEGVAVTGDLLPMLGVHPALGRLFSVAEDREGADAVLLSDALWRGQFGADPGVIGRSIAARWLYASSSSGVMPSGFPLSRSVGDLLDADAAYGGR